MNRLSWESLSLKDSKSLGMIKNKDEFMVYLGKLYGFPKL